MKVTVRYFASLREALGATDTVDVAAADTVGSVRDALMRRSPAHVEALNRKRALRCALNQTLCDESAALEEGAEVAFFPPVTGG